MKDAGHFGILKEFKVSGMLGLVSCGNTYTQPRNYGDLQGSGVACN